MDETHPPRRGFGRILWIFWMSLLYVLDRSIDAFGVNVRIIRQEYELFVGTGLLMVGLLGFESDKYCDGNTADYLSCTRPSTYYYFDSLDTAAVVIGAFFVLLWYLKRHSHR